MATPAPTVGNVVISSQAPGQTQSASAERERAAVQFGGVLQDLVAYSRHLQKEPDTPRVSGPRFPLGPSHRCSPETPPQGALQKLLKLESTLLRLKQLDSGAISPTLPSGKLGIEQGIDALLQGHGQGKERTVRISSEKLLRTLEEQLVNWFGLLSWRFPIVDIVTALTKNLTANLWAQALRLLVPVITNVAVLAPRSPWRKRFSRKDRSSDAALTASKYAERSSGMVSQ